jgi:hypothetical protein
VTVHQIPKGETMPELPALRLVNPRLVKVPDAAPPYDCQIHGPRCDAAQAVTATVGAAPARLVLPASAAVLPAPAAVLPGPAAALPAPAAALPAPEAALPAPEAALPAAAVVIVEVLAGVRPDRQLVLLATDRVRARVRGLAPVLASDRRPKIQRIVTSRPAARVVEMAVVANFGSRSRALAMRFEHVAGRPPAPGRPARPARWSCTALEAG